MVLSQPNAAPTMFPSSYTCKVFSPRISVQLSNCSAGSCHTVLFSNLFGCNSIKCSSIWFLISVYVLVRESKYPRSASQLTRSQLQLIHQPADNIPATDRVVLITDLHSRVSSMVDAGFKNWTHAVAPSNRPAVPSFQASSGARRELRGPFTPRTLFMADIAWRTSWIILIQATLSVLWNTFCSFFRLILCSATTLSLPALISDSTAPIK